MRPFYVSSFDEIPISDLSAIDSRNKINTDRLIKTLFQIRLQEQP